MKKIDSARLAPMDVFEDTGWLRVQLAYARPDCFCGIVYREGARLWLHHDLAAITVLAAKRLHEKNGCRMIIYDGLRTVEAQEAMLQSPAVRANPHWLAEESRVLSPPGVGGHPRGMAVDVSLEDAAGNLLPMGTAFDEFPSGGNGPDENRAHRDYADLPDAVKENRRVLQDAMTGAAAALGLPLVPLSVEWWDFRFPADASRAYTPLSDRDLPPQMRMTDRYADEKAAPDFLPRHFEKMKNEILARLQDL